MRIFGTAAKWLFILCLPILLLTASISWAVNSLWLYKDGFHKYDVSSTTGLADAELENVAASLISYFNSDEDYISLTVVKEGKPFELFNQREVVHLRDVKWLIWLDYRVLLGTLIYALGYAGVSLFRRKSKYWRRLAWGMVGGGSTTLALMLTLGLVILLGFDQLFLQFHLISFSNQLWLLDPTRDYLIMLFPQDFFYDTALFCALATTMGAVVLCGIAGGYLLFTRKRTVS
ncbi:TIGR01906 family membrane protein [Chloroflexota bacterium]